MTARTVRRGRRSAAAAGVAFALLLAAGPPPGRAEEPPPPATAAPSVPVLRPAWGAGGTTPAGGGTGDEAPTVPPLLLWRAEALFQAGRAAEALEKFLELAYDYRDDERKGFVWLRVGELLLARGEPEQALEAAGRAADLSRAPYFVLAAMDVKYRVLLRRRQRAAARELAAVLLRGRYVDSKPAELLAEMARADGEAGQVALALSEFREALGAAAGDPELAPRLRRERDLYVDGLTAIPALRDAGEAEEDAEVRAHLWLTLGTAAAKKGLPGMASFALERAARAGGAWGDEAASRLAAVEKEGAGRPRIVGIVPLTGRHADIGFAVLAGAEVALKAHRRAGGQGPAPVLRWIDTAGQPDRARSQFAAAAADPAVAGFIGPLTGDEGHSVSVAAPPSSPPVLYLGQKGIADKPFVYAFGLTPLQEARAVLAHLARGGQGQVLLFHPENGYGRGFAEAVSAASAPAGVRVAKSVSYPPETTDFTPVIRRAVGEKAFARYARLKEKGTAMELPFKAVVIADRWDRVFLLASQLRHYNIYLPLAGFSGWNEPDLLRKAGDAVNGAVFSADYTEGVSDPQGEIFRREFREALGSSPTRFEAMGYDGASLLASALALAPWDGSAPAGEAVRDRIPRIGSFGGVTGVFEFGPAGELRRKVPLFRIDYGTLVPAPGA